MTQWPPVHSSFFQCLLGLCNDNSFGGDCVSPLSSARYSKETPPFITVPKAGVRGVIYLGPRCVYLSSEQWWDCSFGEPGRDPETSSTFPQRRPHPPVSHLLGDWPATSWTAGPAALESEGKGQHDQWIMNYIRSLIFSIPNEMAIYSQLLNYSGLSTLREKSSPNCERGVHTAHVILCPIKKMMKPPIMCFESSFPAIRWSSVSDFNLPFLPNPMTIRQRLHLLLHYTLHSDLTN